jgi:hypothetical protein
MKKLIQLLEANIKLNSSGCPNIGVDSDISLNLVNDVLLNGICRAAKAAGVNVQITSAVSDHPEKTDSGAISRHSKGQAVDISKINGKSVKDPSNKTNVDNFVSQLEILGYKRNSESGNPKSVLWQMVDHYNHVHVSNTEESSTTSTNSSTSSTEDTKTDVTSNSSGKKIMGDLIGATFGDMLGLKEQRVKKEIGKIRNLLK